MIDSFVGISFFNSNLDRDLFKVFHIKTFVFYNDKPPINLVGPVYLLDTSKYDNLRDQTVLLQSRLVKFFPWLYVPEYEFFVYSDYRIDVHERFFVDLQIDHFPLFLRHREGGVYLHELLRNYDRGRIRSEAFDSINNLIQGRFDMPITENGVMCLQKSDYMDIDVFIYNFRLIQRDQLVVPLLIRGNINYFKYDLSNLIYFHVNSKKFNFVNLLKRCFSFLFTRLK